MHPLAQNVLDYIRRHEFLTPGDRVGVAVSGGADSVGLLRLLLELRSELGIVLAVVHLNHKLRGPDSESDQEFVANVAASHGLEFHSRAADVAQYAAEERLSLEAAARQLRYGYFEELLTYSPELERPLDKIVTGHTLDDQAETVLLRLVRGTGMRGLRAIQPRIFLGDAPDAPGEVIRPLLWVRRHELQRYLGSLGQPWREDATNADPRFSRNRVRHVLLPLLESEFNPAVAENLAELAEIAREEEDYWDNEVAGWMGTAVQRFAPEWSRVLQPASQPLLQIQHGPSPEQHLIEKMEEPGTAVINASINLGWLLSEPIAVQRRVTKAVADDLSLRLEFKHIEAILDFAAQPNATGKRLVLPLGWTVVRARDSLVFTTPDLRVQERTPDYQYALPVPGRTIVPETYSAIEALAVPPAELLGWNPDDLFDPALLATQLLVRNWRPGDRFWPAHTKAPRKVKELLQEKHIPQSERKSWPVVLSGTEIVWVRGFPGRAQFRPPAGHAAVIIREVPLDSNGFSTE